MKYNEQMVSRICEILSTGDHTIADTCKKVGISEATFYVWKNENIEFIEALRTAEEKRLEAFKSMARSGLAILLTGKEYEEVTEEYSVKGKRQTLVARKAVKKQTMPNATATIFALSNMDSSNFKHAHAIDHTTKGEKLPDRSSVDLNNLDDETLRKLRDAIIDEDIQG